MSVIEIRQGNKLVGTVDDFNSVKLGEKDVPFIFRGDELVYPNYITDGLVLFYDFSGMTNSDKNRGIATDLSGNGNHGTLQNFNYTAESGYDKNKLLLDGVDDKLTIPELVLDETAMTVVQDGKIYSYEDDKVMTVGEDGEIIEGGRNLLVGTTQINLASRIQYHSGIINIDGKKAAWFNGERTNNILSIGRGHQLTEGEEYNFSFYAKASTNLSIGRVFVNVGNPNFLANQEITTQWKRYSFSFISKNSNDLTIHMYPEIRKDDGTYEDFYLTDWALTKGKELFPLTPSPQDYKTTTLTPASLTNLQLYNRPLTPEEIAHNYAIEKERFGFDKEIAEEPKLNSLPISQAVIGKTLKVGGD